jgi:hypothetical protein
MASGGASPVAKAGAAIKVKRLVMRKGIRNCEIRLRVIKFNFSLLPQLDVLQNKLSLRRVRLYRLRKTHNRGYGPHRLQKNYWFERRPIPQRLG